MSVNRFRFVSPGVYVNEIDNTRVARPADAIGPVVIGRSRRGPVLRPVKVNSYKEFSDVFGETFPGGEFGDIWRNGNRTSPSYGAYAARAYLRSSGPLTFVRLGGYENPNKDTSTAASAGWSFNHAYGLFAVPVTQSGLNYVPPANSTASLAAIIYANGANYSLSGSSLSGSATNTVQGLGKFVLSDGNLEFVINVNGNKKTVNFDKNHRNYIRNVLNTSPVSTNSRLITNEEDYFLGETFRTFVNSNSQISSTNKFGVVLVKLSSAASNFSDFKKEAEDSLSGWVVGQHLGTPSDFQHSTQSGGPKKLFRVVGLSEGEWNAQNLKISIEDIALPPNQYTKYGSFSLVVRKINDKDTAPSVVERFTNLSLDRYAPNYISKVIGDKYTEWDYDNKLFYQYGEFTNNSSYIRIEVSDEVNNASLESQLVPFGFWLQDSHLPVAVSSSVTGGYLGAVTFISGGLSNAISSSTSFTASFALPEIPILSSSKDNSVPLSKLYFGFKTSLDSGQVFNEDVVDLVRARPVGFASDTYTVSYKLFSLDDVSGSVESNNLETNKELKWVSGSRAASAANSSLTANGYINELLEYCNRFTMPLYGGSDGIDITERDPFNRKVLQNKNELSSYAFNSIKVAIDSVSDPEVVECNIMTIPGVENSSLTGYLMERCETRGDALAIIDLEGDYVPEEGKDSAASTEQERRPNVKQTISNIKDRSLNTSYGCAYFPWVRMSDPSANNTFWAPPSIAALGTFSSSQLLTKLWFAPAGFNRGGLSGVGGGTGAAGLPVIQTALALTSKNRDDLYLANINPIATFPNEGIVIFGQKTLQATPSAVDRINVRRLMIYLKKEVSRFARIVLFDPNLEVTWNRFLELANPFLATVQAEFGLSDYRVILDNTTTTADLVDRNIVYAKILLKPTRSIEFIALDFVIAPTGASFDD